MLVGYKSIVAAFSIGMIRPAMRRHRYIYSDTIGIAKNSIVKPAAAHTRCRKTVYR